MKMIETMEDLEKAINAIDWDELHITRLQYDYGYEAWLYYDEENDQVEICLETQSTIPGPSNKVFAIFPCNIDITPEYSDGWATQNEDTLDYETEDGRILKPMDMAIECIQSGDFWEMYEHWKEEIINDFQEELLRNR